MHTEGCVHAMSLLSKKQVRVLELSRTAVQLRDMKDHGLSRSTTYDAYKRAQKNLNRIIGTVSFLVDHDLLSATQVKRLRRILQKL